MNRTAVLGGVLVALVLALALLVRGGNRADNTASGLLFPKATAADARKIEITPKEGDASLLEKRGEEWVVASQGGFRADAEAVNALFEKVATIEAGNVISKSAEKRSLFEVDSTGLWIKILAEGDKPVADFVIGKSGPDFQSNYVRPSDGDEVYLSSELIRSAFDKGRRGWRDRKILAFAAEEVTAVRFTNGDTTIALRKGGEGMWTVEGDETRVARAPILDGVLRTLSRYMTDDFADSVAADTAGFSPPARTIEVTLSAGEPQVLEVGAMKSPTQYWVRRKGQEMIFVVSKGRVETLFKSHEELTEAKPEPVPAPAAAADSAPPSS